MVAAAGMDDRRRWGRRVNDNGAALEPPALWKKD